MANSKKRCKHCEQFQLVGLGFPSTGGFFCSVDHARKFQRQKLDEKNKRLQNKAKLKYERLPDNSKRSTKTPGEIRSEAQTSFNRYIRIRDFFEGCPTCDRSKEEIEKAQGWKSGGPWHAGHFQSRGRKGQLRFHLLNCHKQCNDCNSGIKYPASEHSIAVAFELFMIKKLGPDYVQALQNNNNIDIHKNDIEYFQRIKKIFNKRYRVYLRIKKLR